MALIKCEECGKEISNKADTCPNCGYPIDHIRKPVPRNFFVTACLFNAHLVGFAYTIFCLFYWSNASNGMSGFEKWGTDIATVLIIPHVILVILATIFNTFALFSYHRCFTMTSAILYCAAILFAPSYFYFVIIQAILCFIAFFFMKSNGKVSVRLKGLLSATSILCALMSMILLLQNINTTGNNKKAAASSVQDTTDQTSATTESSSSLLINQETPTSNTTTSVPQEYQVALNKAQNYNDTLPMSESGLYKQLTEYEKFSTDAAQYAIDNLNADWYDNALKKAKSYSETMSMSSDAIYEQLVSYEQFTEDQASYAIQHLYD